MTGFVEGNILNLKGIDGIMKNKVHRDYIDDTLIADIEALQIAVDNKIEKTPTTWTAPTLLNGWTNFGLYGLSTAGYFKNELDEVSIRGSLKGGQITNDTFLFVLPEGFRPSENLTFTISFYENASPKLGSIGITIDGSVFTFGITNSERLVLDNIRFKAER